jgi:hypothetical protein
LISLDLAHQSEVSRDINTNHGSEERMLMRVSSVQHEKYNREQQPRERGKARYTLPRRLAVLLARTEVRR